MAAVTVHIILSEISQIQKDNYCMISCSILEYTQNMQSKNIKLREEIETAE